MNTREMNKALRRRKRNIKRQRKRQRRVLVLTMVTIILIGILTAINFRDKADASLLAEVQNKIVEKKFVVCIDPGHGGYDVGCTSRSGVREKEITLKVGLMLGELLNKEDIKVIYTRDSDEVSWPSNEKADIKERVKISNDSKADLFISIHCNQIKDPAIKGIELWCKNPNSDDEDLAREIKMELMRLDYTKFRDIKYESQKSMGVLRNNEATSVLVELGYTSNTSDDKYLTSEDGQENCAKALEKAVLNYKNSIKK